MKKFWRRIAAIALALSALSGCASRAPASADYRSVYAEEITSLDYLLHGDASGSFVYANMVDGLMENDAYGRFTECLASGVSANEDASVWTFTLRKGVQWVRADGTAYGELKAQDFVTGLQHAADFRSEESALLEGVIQNYAEYVRGEITDFSQVGVKALDDHTVEYTLTGPFPYFNQLTTHGILYPLSREFLESRGAGCALGSPDPESCTFGSLSPDSVLYNGGYLLTRIASRSEIEMEKNESYWDAGHVYCGKITWTYDDGSDDHFAMEGFEDGRLDEAAIRHDWGRDDLASYLEKYDGLSYIPPADGCTYVIGFNYDRRSFAYSGADGVEKTQEEKDAVQLAIRNRHFRLALLAGIDRTACARCLSGAQDTAEAMIRNAFAPLGDGAYEQLVSEKIREMSPEETGDSLDLSDGQDPYYDPQKAGQLLDRAEEEGVKFPVTLDLPVNGADSSMEEAAYVLRESLEASSGGRVLVHVVVVQDEQEYHAHTDQAESGADCDFDIAFTGGWNVSCADPAPHLELFLPEGGRALGLLGIQSGASEDSGTPADQQIMEELGLYEYQKMLEEAEKATEPKERLEALAECDGWLIASAIAIPLSCSPIDRMVSRVKPFTREWGWGGLSGHKLKYVIVQDSMVREEEYEKALRKWQSVRASAGEDE